MDTHDKMETIFNTDEQLFLIVNINIEFSFYHIVNENACLYADLIVFRVPVCFVRYGYSVPSVWVHVSKSLSYDFDDSFSEDMRLNTNI